MIVIDGSFGEGGGSILRNAISLSLITQKPFRLINIRSNRPKKGLSAQHVKCLDVAKIVCNGKVTNNFVGSQEVEFFPGKISNGKEVEIDIGTAGSISLLLQSVFLPCFLSKKSFKFTVSGGTDVSFSPGVDYFNEVYLSFFRSYGKVNFEISRRGYYPKGDGLVVFSFKGKEDLKPLSLIDRGDFLALKTFVHSSKSYESLGICDNLTKALNIYLSDVPTSLINKMAYFDTKSAGFGVFLLAQYENIKLGVSSLDKDLDVLAKNSSSLMKNIIGMGFGVDHFLADQLIPVIGLFKGEIVVDEITDHIISNIYVCELFLGEKYKVNKKINEISVL